MSHEADADTDVDIQRESVLADCRFLLVNVNTAL